MKKWALLLILILADQMSKYIVGHRIINIFKGFSIKYVQNYGAAFGILPGHYPIFVVSAIILIIVIASYYKKSHSKYGLVFLLAGTIGNLIDRMVFHYVRDFISIWIFPVFNLADIFNWIGLFLLLWGLRSNSIRRITMERGSIKRKNTAKRSIKRNRKNKIKNRSGYKD